MSAAAVLRAMRSRNRVDAPLSAARPARAETYGSFVDVLLADEASTRDPGRLGDALGRFGDEGADPHQDPIEIGEGE